MYLYNKKEHDRAGRNGLLFSCLSMMMRTEKVPVKVGCIYEFMLANRGQEMHRQVNECAV